MNFFFFVQKKINKKMKMYCIFVDCIAMYSLMQLLCVFPKNTCRLEMFGNIIPEAIIFEKNGLETLKNSTETMVWQF